MFSEEAHVDGNLGVAIRVQSHRTIPLGWIRVPATDCDLASTLCLRLAQIKKRILVALDLSIPNVDPSRMTSIAQQLTESPI